MIVIQEYTVQLDYIVLVILINNLPTIEQTKENMSNSAYARKFL